MATSPGNSKALHVFLWIAQLLLAVTFLWAAYMKLLAPVAELNGMWPWTAANPGLVKLTGIVDLLAGLGLLLPTLLRVAPRLTIWTAYSIIALMIAASAFHISRGETSQIGFNVFVAAMAAFVAWGRNRRP